MANQITGKIHYIYPSQEVPSKDGSKTYVKRSIVLDCTRYDPYTGERGIENTPLLEFIGDKCAELDNYQVGQVVTISFDVRGSRYTNREGKEQIYTGLQPYKIEMKQTAQHSAAQATQQAPTQQPTQTSPADKLPF